MAIMSHYDLNNDTFEEQVENATFDAALFNHEAHVRLAWIHITKYGRVQAIENITCQLQAFVTSLGIPGKYNHTMTVAAIKTVDQYVQQFPVDNFAEFITACPGLKTNFRVLMAQHYRNDIYNLWSAGSVYLDPDLVPYS